MPEGDPSAFCLGYSTTSTSSKDYQVSGLSVLVASHNCMLLMPVGVSSANAGPGIVTRRNIRLHKEDYVVPVVGATAGRSFGYPVIVAPQAAGRHVRRRSMSQSRSLD